MTLDPNQPILQMDPIVPGDEHPDQVMQTFRVLSPHPLPAEGVARYVEYLRDYRFVPNLREGGYAQIDLHNIDARLLPKIDDHGQPDPHGFSLTFVVLASKNAAVIH